MSTDIRWIEENAETPAIAVAAVRLHSMLSDNYSERGCLHMAREALKVAAAARPVPQAGEVAELAGNLRKWAGVLETPSSPFVNGDCRIAADLLTAQAAEIERLQDARQTVVDAANQFCRDIDALNAALAAKDAELKHIMNWLKRNASAEKEPKARAALIEAHNAVLKIIAEHDTIALDEASGTEESDAH